MITLIGTTETTIGFGLCGMKDVYEVTLETSTEEINRIIAESENNLIMIDELLAKKVTLATQKTIITIPYRHGEANTDFINELMKNTIGVVQSWEK